MIQTQPQTPYLQYTKPIFTQTSHHFKHHIPLITSIATTTSTPNLKHLTCSTPNPHLPKPATNSSAKFHTSSGLLHHDNHDKPWTPYLQCTKPVLTQFSHQFNTSPGKSKDHLILIQLKYRRQFSEPFTIPASNPK